MKDNIRFEISKNIDNQFVTLLATTYIRPNIKCVQFDINDNQDYHHLHFQLSENEVKQLDMLLTSERSIRSFRHCDVYMSFSRFEDDVITIKIANYYIALSIELNLNEFIAMMLTIGAHCCTIEDEYQPTDWKDRIRFNVEFDDEHMLNVFKRTVINYLENEFQQINSQDEELKFDFDQCEIGVFLSTDRRYFEVDISQEGHDTTVIELYFGRNYDKVLEADIIGGY